MTLLIVTVTHYTSLIVTAIVPGSSNGTSNSKRNVNVNNTDNSNGDGNRNGTSDSKGRASHTSM